MVKWHPLLSTVGLIISALKRVRASLTTTTTGSPETGTPPLTCGGHPGEHTEVDITVFGVNGFLLVFVNDRQPQGPPPELIDVPRASSFAHGRTIIGTIYGGWRDATCILPGRLFYPSGE